MIRTINALPGHGVKAARGIPTFTRLSKKVVVEINKLGKDRAQRIEAGLQKLSEYAHEVVRRVPSVVDHSQRKVKQLRKRAEYKQARVIEKLME